MLPCNRITLWIEYLTCGICTGVCIPSCSYSATAHSMILKLLIGQFKMALAPSQLQFTPIAQDCRSAAGTRAWYTDLFTCWKRTALVGGILSIVVGPLVKSCFLASSTLLRVYVLLYMTMMNLSSAVILCVSTSFVCEERVVKVAGQAIHADQVDFFPFV